MYTFLEPPENLDRYEEPRLHLESLLNFHLIETPLNIRIVTLLVNAGIKRLGDLVRCDRARLLGIRNIGVRSLEEIEGFLDRIDLSLGMTDFSGE